MQQHMSTAGDATAGALGVPQVPVHHDSVTRQSNSLRATPNISQFDPRTLLNPKSSAKRPATNQEPERGREDSSTTGQSSLVERFHHVQERTASPAKRIRSKDEQKKAVKSQIAGGGSLDLEPNRQKQATPAQVSTIDLTMSKILTYNLPKYWLTSCR